MLFTEKLDVIEEDIQNYEKDLLDILLYDRSARKNIIWATDNYIENGEGFGPTDYITPDLVTGQYSRLIRPRIEKSLDEQSARTKDKAEVFTPCWICNEQNNLIDHEWFSGKDVFNIAMPGNTWKTIEDKIPFPEKGPRRWQKYVDAKRLEMSCGEAPYLVSRYDTVTGREIPIKDRIGLLDRKLRVVNENTDNEEEWLKWAQRAFEATYAYELQGDSLLLARENLLITFMDYYSDRFKKNPDKKMLLSIARIISWNIWQMDGLKYVVPYSCRPVITEDNTIFGVVKTECECPGCKYDRFDKHTGVYCRIMDWREKASLPYITMMEGETGS